MKIERVECTVPWQRWGGRAGHQVEMDFQRKGDILSETRGDE